MLMGSTDTLIIENTKTLHEDLRELGFVVSFLSVEIRVSAVFYNTEEEVERLLEHVVA
jgi:selenocysteine lyase/cysteine desulfurase